MFLISKAHAGAYMPPVASTFGDAFDNLYGFLVISSLIACILVIGGFIYFAIKYRRQSESDKTAYITHSNVLEFTWSFVPFLIFMFVFAWGWIIYNDMRTFPDESLEVHVVAQQWNWTFLYKSGKQTTEEMVVPINTPVKLIMSSKDVLHSFSVPAFRIKQDVVPGRYTALGFTATKLGNFQVFCTEYCGVAHSSMLTKIRVVTLDEYEEWLRQGDVYEGMSLAEIGQKIYTQRCKVCHHTTDIANIGPGFKGLWQSQRSFVKAAATIADENYIRESILNPKAKIVAGFEGRVMTSFAGQLDDKELTAIIEFMKTLK